MAAVLRVLVVGAGSISREYALHHFPACPRTRVVGVVDLDDARARALAQDVGSVAAGAQVVNGSGRGYSAAPTETRGAPVPSGPALTPDLLSACDMVYVGTTPASHRGIVEAALRAGKHVLLEKPLAATPGDADAIVAAATAAERRGVQLGMDIGMRWNRALLEMRRLALDERALGTLSGGKLSLHFAQWPRAWQVQPWCARRQQGGALREVGTHWFFALMELFGHRCVRRVRSTVVYPPGDGDAAEVSAEGELELSSGLAVRLSLRCDGGGLAADGQDHYVLALEGDAGDRLEMFAFTSLRRVSPGRPARVLVDGASYGRVDCLTELLAAAADGAAPADGPGHITASEGRNAQRVLDAVLASGGDWLAVEYD